MIAQTTRERSTQTLYIQTKSSSAREVHRSKLGLSFKNALFIQMGSLSLSSPHSLFCLSFSRMGFSLLYSFLSLSRGTRNSRRSFQRLVSALRLPLYWTVVHILSHSLLGYKNRPNPPVIYCPRSYARAGEEDTHIYIYMRVPASEYNEPRRPFCTKWIFCFVLLFHFCCRNIITQVNEAMNFRLCSER